MNKSIIVFSIVCVVFLGSFFLYEREKSPVQPIVIDTGIVVQQPQDFQENGPDWSGKEEGIQARVENIPAFSKVLTAPDWIQTGEYARYYDSGNNTWFAKVKGYTHVYHFDDLGITLGIKDPFMDQFYQKNPPVFYKRYKNIVYQIDQPWIYIQRLSREIPHTKDSENPNSISFKVPYSGADHYFKISAPDGCAPTCGIFTQLDLK